MDRAITVKVEMPAELKEGVIKAAWFNGAQAGLFGSLILVLGIYVLVTRRK